LNNNFQIEVHHKSEEYQEDSGANASHTLPAYIWGVERVSRKDA
jgi:hypothetical protein